MQRCPKRETNLVHLQQIDVYVRWRNWWQENCCQNMQEGIGTKETVAEAAAFNTIPSHCGFWSTTK